MFVSGPVGTSVIGLRLAVSVSRSNRSHAPPPACAKAGEVRAVEPGLAVHVRGDVPFAHERTVGARRHRDLGTSDVIEDADGVCGRLLERLIAGHRGDAEQVHFRAGEGEEQRDRVVMTRIAVEDDVGHALRVRTRPPVGLIAGTRGTSTWSGRRPCRARAGGRPAGTPRRAGGPR